LGIRDEYLALRRDAPTATADLVTFLNNYGAPSTMEKDEPFLPVEVLWESHERLRYG
jgi:hypothetical protein